MANSKNDTSRSEKDVDSKQSTQEQQATGVPSVGGSIPGRQATPLTAFPDTPGGEAPPQASVDQVAESQTANLAQTRAANGDETQPANSDDPEGLATRGASHSRTAQSTTKSEDAEGDKDAEKDSKRSAKK